MGMDVSGRNPKNETGEYFRANCWGWRPIHVMIAGICGDILDNETIDSMGYNDGAGPENQDICDKMAERFEMILKRATGDEFKFQDNPDYSITREDLEEWIEFLKNCGGFEVW